MNVVMNRIYKILFILFSVVLFVCSCSYSDEELESIMAEKDKATLTVEAYVTGFGKVDASRADAKSAFDTQIGTLYMLVFDASGNIVGEPQFTGGSTPTFIIDRLNDPAYVNHPNKSLLESCTIYMVANLRYGDLDNIKTIDELLDYEITATTIHPDKDITTYGLVMIGASSSLNLSPESTGVANVTQIWLESIYSKIQVKIKVDAIQTTDNYIPQFKMTSWRAVNVPTYARFRTPVADEPTWYVENSVQKYMELSPEVAVVGQNPVTHGVDSLSFTFYVLEHKVNPHNVDGTTKEYREYPANITQKDKQRFKPLLCDATQHPLYVEIIGEYSDHHGDTKHVTYKLYLGGNNYDNFHILRNAQYNNDVLITGTTNHILAEINSISIDHRVNIARDNYWVEMEREVILDSHIEVRPFDIEFTDAAVAKGTARVELAFVNPAQVTVDRDDPEYITTSDVDYQWVRMEKKSSATLVESAYCPNGKRKYFTSTLMNELNTNSGIRNTITIDDFNNGDNRVWIYFDENLYASKDNQRDCMLLVSYYESDSDTEPDNEYFHFRQHDLFPVEFNGNKYYIEYNEEYLYNFDPKENFGNTTDGMPWGGNGVVSDSIQAFENASGLAGSSWFSYLEDIMQANGGYYDFKDNYTGHEYTRNLVNKGRNTILTLAEMPRSAAEYCYNKNKRDANGNVTTSTFNWYLPAIGEIQEIARGAYSTFRVFQNHWYWSSQTTYGNGHFDYYSFGQSWRTGYGDFKYEHEQMARATKVEYLGNDQYDYAPSEVTGEFGRVLKCTSLLFGWGLDSEWTIRDNDINNIPNTIILDAGNKVRTEIHRVRAVRRNNGDIIER